MEENIIKLTCKKLGITYRELAEAIGYKSDTVNSVASRGEVSEPMQKAIELYLKTLGASLDEENNLPGAQNIVKKACGILEITQKELADKLGIDDGTVRKWSSEPTKTPLWAKIFIDALLENKQLKADIKTLIDAQSVIKKYS